MNNETENEIIATEADSTKKPHSIIEDIYELVEMLALVTVIVMLCFAFVVRLNIVQGDSMLNTLHSGDALAVTDLFYEPKAGDIVIIHKIDADPYCDPIVKRVIATENQVVDIDFNTWTLTVDGKIVEESYRYISDENLLTADYDFPITVPEGEIFVLGDNRNGSADSRQIEIGTVDVRCVVGKAFAKLYPFSDTTLFSDPYTE